MPVQVRNDELIGLLGGDFQRRYEPNFALGQAVSTYLALPGLRGFWTMGSHDATPRVSDLSGQGRHLTLAGASLNDMITFMNLAPAFRSSITATRHLVRADEGGFRITGAETHVASTRRGLTLGAWVHFYELPQNASIMAKYHTSAQRSYMLVAVSANSYLSGIISVDGTNTFTVVSDNDTIDTGEWIFTAMRFEPSTRLKIWINDNTWENTTSVPASIYNSTSEFNIAASQDGGGNHMNGWHSFSFLCAMALSDSYMFNLYHQTRALFGV